MRYYIGTPPASPYLEHHGILGMKWGVRRYQNEDGSLTEEGKARYGYGSLSKNADYSDPKKLAKAQKGWQQAVNDNYISLYNNTADMMNNGAIAKFNKHWDKVKIDDVDKWNKEYEEAYFKSFDAMFAMNAYRVFGATPGSDADAIMKEASDILKENGIFD